MPEKVTFTVDAEHAQAIQAFLNVSAAMKSAAATGETIGQKVSKGGEDAAKSWQGGLNVLSSWPMALGRAAGGITGILAAMKLVSAEYGRWQELSKTALAAQDAGQVGYQRMLTNMPEGWLTKPGARNKFVQEGLRRSRRDDAGAGFFESAAIGVGAAGAMSEEQATKAILDVAEIAGRAGMPAEDQQPFQGVVNDIMNAQLAKEGKADSKEIAGALVKMMQIARSTTVHDLATFDAREILYAYTKGGARTLGEAIGWQAGVAKEMPDPKGRKAATGTVNIWEVFRKAFVETQTDNRMPMELPAGMESVADWDKMNMTEKLAFMRQKNDFAMMMRTRMLGGASTIQEERDMAQALNLGYGMLHGEAGMRQMAEGILRPGGSIEKEAMRAAAYVDAEGGGRAYYDRFINRPYASQQERNQAVRMDQAGANAAAQWANTVQASRGNILEGVQKRGEAIGTGWLDQTGREIYTNFATRGATQEQLEGLRSESLGWSIQDIYQKIFRREYSKSHGTIRANDRERLKQLARPDELEMLQTYENQFNLLSGPTVGGAELNMTKEETRARMASSYEAYRARKNRGFGKTMSADDLGAPIDLLTEEIRVLTAGLSNQQLEVRSVDEVGRELGRGTSSPRAIEQFYDTPLPPQ